MTQRVRETSLGLLQSPTLRAASKGSEELSAAGNTEQADAPSAWGRPRRGQPPRLCRALENCEFMGEAQGVPSHMRRDRQQLTRPIKYLQALDFVLSFCVKSSSHAKGQAPGWVGAGRRTVLRKLLPPSKPGRPRPRSELGTNCLLSRIMPNSVVFFDVDEVPLGIKLRSPNSFYPDPGVRLERLSGGSISRLLPLVLSKPQLWTVFEDCLKYWLL